jgi:hypothetical protein
MPEDGGAASDANGTSPEFRAQRRQPAVVDSDAEEGGGAL